MRGSQGGTREAGASITTYVLQVRMKQSEFPRRPAQEGDTPRFCLKSDARRFRMQLEMLWWLVRVTWKHLSPGPLCGVVKGQLATAEACIW